MIRFTKDGKVDRAQLDIKGWPSRAELADALDAAVAALLDISMRSDDDVHATPYADDALRQIGADHAD